MKELNDLNNIYQDMYNVDEAMVVTAADKKANTPAYQNYKKGLKNKKGEPVYKAADHLKDDVEFKPSEEVKKLVESGKFSKEEIWKIVALDELKKSTLGSYVAKGSKDLANRRFDQGDSEKRKYDPDEADDKEDKKLDKREQGIARAAKKLSKEGYQRDPEGGEEKARQRRRSQKGGDRTEKVRGERTPMPPRGDKRREDFERWYAANVR